MTRQSHILSTLRGVLAGLALASVLFMGMVAGLHVGEDHAAGTCDICQVLDHLGLDVPELPFLVGSHGPDVPLAVPVLDQPSVVVLGDDPARAPPSLS